MEEIVEYPQYFSRLFWFGISFHLLNAVSGEYLSAGRTESVMEHHGYIARDSREDKTEDRGRKEGTAA